MAILIVPGLARATPDHWQARWQAELALVERVDHAETGHPRLASWLETLREHVERRPNVVLVGHGLGSTLIAHLAARYSDLPVGGAMLVAPVDPEASVPATAGLASFGPLPDEPFPFPAFVVASRTDPHMNIDRARIFANMWDAAFIDAGDAGHIDARSGLGHWPAGLHLLDQLTSSRVGFPIFGPRKRSPMRSALH